MKSHRVKVYYRVMEPGESPAASTPLQLATERFTDEPTAGRYMQDRHTRYVVLHLAERSDAAVLTSLEQRHPRHVVAVDQVEWLS